MKQHDISDEHVPEPEQNAEEPEKSVSAPANAAGSLPQREFFVTKEFARYLTPEFTQQLMDHMFRAKKAALREARENP